MNKELFKKLNIPEIPTDINELRSYSDLFKLFDISQKIVDNYNHYLMLIVDTEYLKTKQDWKEILNPNDYEKIKNFQFRFHFGNFGLETNPLIFRCNKTNEFIPCMPKQSVSPSGGGGWNISYKYDKATMEIIVTMEIKLQAYRHPGIQPVTFYQIYKINLLEKSVTEIT